MTTQSIADVLERAADLIIERGWTQGVFSNDAGCYCIYGAAVSVGPYSAFDWMEHSSMPTGFRSLIDWNDAPGRTQAEVVAKLREAAALAREEGK